MQDEEIARKVQEFAKLFAKTERAEFIVETLSDALKDTPWDVNLHWREGAKQWKTTERSVISPSSS